MKNVLAAIIFLLPIVSTAQTESQGLTDGYNMVKLNISAFAFKGFGLQYERKLSHRFTVALSYSAIPKSNIAFQSTIQNIIDDPDVEVGNFRLGTSVFTPEVRWYVGKKGAYRGFYLAPYVRISTYDMQVPVNFGSGPSPRQALFNGKLHNYTGGLMIGSQYKLSERLYLDWWIIGASIGGANGDLIAAIPLNTMEQQQLQNQVNDINVPFTNTEITVNSNGAVVKTKGTMAGVRGFGINLGFRF